MRTAIALSLTALAAAVPGSAQEDERMYRPPTDVQAIIYRDAYYSGPAVAAEGPRPNLGLAWQVRSIRVKSGQWQICTGPKYTGRCTTVDRDTPNLASQYRSLQSMRPMGGGSGGGGSGRSLRGMAAEFFPEPMRNGQRITCPGGQATAACAKQAADNFCRSAGWNGSRNQTFQTVSGRHYITDVLCVRAGF